LGREHTQQKGELQRQKQAGLTTLQRETGLDRFDGERESQEVEVAVVDPWSKGSRPTEKGVATSYKGVVTPLLAGQTGLDIFDGELEAQKGEVEVVDPWFQDHLSLRIHWVELRGGVYDQQSVRHCQQGV
jgi:hypothetical protein